MMLINAFSWSGVFIVGLRYCEMGQAVLARARDEPLARPKTVYCGLLFDNKDAEQALQEKVYNGWDSDPNSPPSSRTAEPLPDPVLQILGFQGGRPFFPESLLRKFLPGTAASKKVLDMKAELEQLFPTGAEVSASGRSVVVTPRAGGRPDFTIEGGQEPIDPTQAMDADVITAANFNEPRPSQCRS